MVEQLPGVGRVLFAAHLRMPRPVDPVLSGWHAVNCLREWRGDTHWALVAAAGLTGVEASILHNAWLGYEPDWLPTSRGTDPADLDAGWRSLAERGLAEGRRVLPAGVALRQRLEDETDRLTTLPWRLLGSGATDRFAGEFEGPCERLLDRVDVTAGPNYQPASRLRPPRPGPGPGSPAGIATVVPSAETSSTPRPGMPRPSQGARVTAPPPSGEHQP